MAYILAIDQGTSSTRAIIYSIDGQHICSAHYPITQFYPHPGWVEQDPEEIWQKTLLAIQDVVEHVDIQDILACGLTNQRETTLIWDKETGQCLAPAIVWQDRRTEHFCQTLAKDNAMIQKKTGLLVDPYFSATKLHWLLEHIPSARLYAEQGRLAFGTVDSFLIWRLTGGVQHATDVTNASRTMLFNIHSEIWDDALLKTFDIPKSILPRVYASDHCFGVISQDLIQGAIPICGVIGDQQAALLGHGCTSPGMIKATYGTGGFLMLNTGDIPVVSKHRLLTTVAYKIQDQTAYALEGSLYQAGSTVQWLRDTLKLIRHANETETLAASLKSNEGVYFIPSFNGLGAPHWLSTPGALIVGLKRTSHRAHFARAALESVCYQTLDMLVAMRQDSKLDLSLLRVDGGMVVNEWFLNFLSSLCVVTAQRSRHIETTAFGAAMLAAIGCGAIQDLSTLKDRCLVEKQFVADKSELDMKQDYQGWLSIIEMINNLAPLRY